MRALVLLFVCLGFAAPAVAQEREPSQRQLLVDLSYVMGESHALRQRCRGLEDSYWYERMRRLIQTESSDTHFRNRLVDSFNDGFSAAQSQYPVCSAQSRAAEASIAIQGQNFANRLSQSMMGAQKPPIAEPLAPR